MTKTAGKRNRSKDLAHTLYTLAVAACVAWAVLLFMDGLERISSACFLLFNLLPLVAFVIDIVSNPDPEEK
jgi:hypothetical protein